MESQTLEETFSAFYEVFLPARGFAPISGTRQTSNAGSCEEFKNVDLRLLLGLDRGLPFVNVGPSFADSGTNFEGQWIDAVRLLRTFRGVSQQSPEPNAIAAGLEEVYGQLRSFFRRDGWPDRFLGFH